jgi:uncharacterized protein YdaU (DUF1376 family)
VTTKTSNTFESPWWYRQVPRDFMSSPDVQLMTAEECGSFFFLLQWAWLTGEDCTLPNDPERLAKLARVTAVAKIVLDKFSVDKDGRLFNPRLSMEWKEALRRSKDGKKNAQKRWEGSMPRHSGGKATAEPAQSHGNATNTNTNTNTNKSKTMQTHTEVLPSSAEAVSVSTSTPSAQRLTQKLMTILGRENLKPATATAWAEKVQTLIDAGHTEKTIADVMQWALADSGDGFWRGRVFAMKNFANGFKAMHKQFQTRGQKPGAADALAQRVASLQTGHDFSAMAKGDV